MWSVAVVVLTCLVEHVTAAVGDYCGDSIFSQTWCEYGCCGVNDDYCCQVDAAVALGVGVIIAIVIGVCVVVGGIIALICCCVRRQGYAGSVMTRQQAPGIVITSQTTHMQPTMYGVQSGYDQPQMTYPQTQPMAPPPYGQTNMGCAGGVASPPPAYPVGTDATQQPDVKY
ncbi:hypothetical protein ScPMuIL_008214 [Solemya velum]